MTINNAIVVKNLGQVDYQTTVDDMRTFTKVRDEHTADELWLVEHPPVLTLGQAGKEEHLLTKSNIEVVRTDRGGQVTYHGPGQVVIYCLCDLKRLNMGIRTFVCLLERAMIALLAEYNIEAKGDRSAPGVYVNDKKIGAIGLRVKRGCSYHGLALNVDMNLTPFSFINPCGYPALKVTQLSDLTTKKVITDAVGVRLTEILQSMMQNTV